MRATLIAASVSALALGALLEGFTISAGDTAPGTVQQRAAAVGPTMDGLASGPGDNNGNG
jgi:hypothetical protein